MKEDSQEWIGIRFPRTNMTVIHLKGTGKPFAKIMLNEKSGYKDFSFIWRKEKVKTVRERKNWRYINMPADWKVELRKYKVDGDDDRVITEIKRVTGRELSEIMKKQTGEEE